MPKYRLSYQVLSDFMVVVEADSADEAKDMLLESGAPTGSVGGAEVEWTSTDIYYDSIEVSEEE